MMNWGFRKLYFDIYVPRKNGFCDRFNGITRDNLLDGELFYSLSRLESLSINTPYFSDNI